MIALMIFKFPQISYHTLQFCKVNLMITDALSKSKQFKLQIETTILHYQILYHFYRNFVKLNIAKIFPSPF